MSDNVTVMLTGTLDEQKKAIKELTEARLKWKLGGVSNIPEQLSYIVTEVCISRFNKIGSEGLTSHTVEGESMRWSDDDFAPYAGEIQDYLNAQKDSNRGVIRFL